MKSVKSLVKWILFVPVCIMSVTLTIISCANPELSKNFLATDMNGIAEIVAFSILGLFVVCFALSLFDRTTSPLHLLRKNYFCGITAFVAAFAFAATAALDVTTMIQLNMIDIMSMITSVFTALSGVALLFVGISHFSGTNTNKGLAIFYLVLPLWCGVHLIDRFLKHTATPVDAADTLDLVMFVALAMFFINATMVHVLIPGKNAVKSAVTYGFPAVVSSLVYGISLVFAVLSSDKADFIDFIPAIGYAVIGLYILGFTAELSFKAKSVEEQMVVEIADENADTYTDTDTDTEETVQETPDCTEGVVCETEVSVSADSSVADEDFIPFDNTSEPSETTEDTTSDYAVEDITLFDDVEDISEETEEFEDADEVVPVMETVSTEILAKLPENSEDSPQECDIAEELYREAQQMDTIREKEATDIVTSESEKDMIIDGKDSVAEAAPSKAPVSESRPKGPTIREAVMYDDEDFIIAIENSDASADIPSGTGEDISSFILEKEESVTSAEVVEKTYADRLDEIDQLIISIQGGEPETEE